MFSDHDGPQGNLTKMPIVSKIIIIFQTDALITPNMLQAVKNGQMLATVLQVFNEGLIFQARLVRHG